MSIIINPLSPERLAVSGDLDMTLRIPYDSDEDRFHLAFSDGTLIAGEYDPEENRFSYFVETEGAGLVHIEGHSLTLAWRVEWATIALYQPTHRTPQSLPLFEYRGFGKRPIIPLDRH